MYLEHLSLTDFRSYAQVDLALTPGVTVLVGSNGLGKTNLVESIGYLATLSSHRVSQDAPLLRFGTDRALIRAQLVRAEQKVMVEVEINATRANRARINRANPVRARDILGICRTVLFAPEDLALVKGDPGNRRRFLDDLLVVLLPKHAGTRSDYDRVLKQRNALLKSARSQHFSRSGVSESHLATLDVWDEHMAMAAAGLLLARLDLLNRLRPHLAQAYAELTDGSKILRALYRSSLDQITISGPPESPPQEEHDDATYSAFGEPTGGVLPEVLDGEDLSLCPVEELAQRYRTVLTASRTRELERGMSLVGPHRDELDLLLGNAPARSYASHGESWSIALALRLASFHVLDEDKHVAGNQPILILDDVFAELDAQRRRKLASMVGAAEQVLVTAAVGADIPEELSGSTIQVIPGGVMNHD
ncbi:DNA replication/repair protein RecF [Arthrobacter psychrochitiniphilus]|uniref:DNA replication and repair protein RecF n=1 Tax=Arthrobacter psychrochitiniphilus TaxID=291045 RepID=A0A2V3DYI0_9MICC|nr:DNA replication/repair protein RecF [Arthrobacter psychrochitiniphilus]NYG19224.1 DNA replication and repair protein RecF [Arthrobacter psychrochitiniphilus]PXA65833.1 DNA replication/repair protein RecF [Arthrobacter psychrochitiniphilus]